MNKEIREWEPGRFGLILFGIGVCFMGYLVFTSSGEPEYKNRPYLVENIGDDIISTNPQQISRIADVRVNNDLFEGLLEYNQDSEVWCAAAEKYTVSEDGSVYTFTLRKSQWSNGDPLVADDFVYSFRRAVSPKTLTRCYVDLYRDIKNANEIIEGKMRATELGVTAVDENTVQITLCRPDPLFTKKLAMYCFRPVCRRAFLRYGNKAYTSAATTISNGPFFMKEWVYNDHILLEEHEHHWDNRKVHMHNVKFLMITDAVASLQAFDSGLIDISYINLPLKDESWYVNKYGSQYHKYNVLHLEHYLFNMKKFSDIRVRKALNIVIDRKSLIKKVAITAKEVYSPILETSFSDKYNNIDNAMPEYDWVNKPMNERIEMGKKLLAEAGYSKDKPLKFTLSYNSNDINKNVAVAIQTIWNTVFEGAVVAEIYSTDKKTHIANLENLNYDISRRRWGADYMSPDNFIMLYVSNSPENHQAYSNELVNKLYMNYKLGKCEDCESEQYRIGGILMRDYPVIVLYSPIASRLVNDRVLGFECDKNCMNNFFSRYYKFKDEFTAH